MLFLWDNIISGFLDGNVLHVLNTEKQANQVRWASGPWLDVNVWEILTPFGKILWVGHLNVLVLLHLHEVQYQGAERKHQKWGFWTEFIYAVQKQEKHWDDEDLHVILQIPSPTHTHFLSIVNQIINEEHGFPYSWTIFNLIGGLILEPEYSMSCLQENCI